MSDKQPAIIRSNAPRMVEVVAGSLNAKGKNNFINPADAAEIGAPDLEKIKNELKSHLEALEQIKDSHKDQTIHKSNLNSDNTQKVATDLFEEHNLKVGVEATKSNTQLLKSGSASKDHKETLTSEDEIANLQKISIEKTQANLQNIETDGISDHSELLKNKNSQGLNQAKLDLPETIEENKQKFVTNGKTLNHQAVDEKAIDANLQKISSSQNQDNNNEIDTTSIAGNNQKIKTTNSGSDSIGIKNDAQESNLQDVHEDKVLGNNNQKIEEGKNSTNRAKLDSTSIEENTIGISKDKDDSNQAKIGSHNNIDHNEAITSDSASPNNQSLDHENDSSNHQKISNHQSANQANVISTEDGTNQQKLDADKSNEVNAQSIKKTNSESNHQTLPANINGNNEQKIDEEKSNLNRQAAPQDSSSENQQKVPAHLTQKNNQLIPSNKNLQNLQGASEQGAKITQSSFDVSKESHEENSSIRNDQNSFKEKAIAKSLSNTDIRSKLTSAQQAAIAEKKKQQEEFHGRVEVIKNEVQRLNSRLDKIEDDHTIIMKNSL